MELLFVNISPLYSKIHNFNTINLAGGCGWEGSGAAGEAPHHYPRQHRQ